MSRIAVLLALPLAAAVLCGVLMPSSLARAPRGPARLELTSADLDLGELEPADLRTVDLSWRRRGAGTLRVLAVRASCGCVTVDAPVSPLACGARGTIRLRLRATRAEGPFVQRVRIFTDARPPHDLLTCRLRGFVGSPVACAPARLDLGRCSPGRRVERTVEVRWGSAAGVADARALRPAWHGLEGAVVVEPPARRDVPGCLLRLTVTIPPAPGPFAGEVRLTAGGARIATLPVRGTVAPETHSK